MDAYLNDPFLREMMEHRTVLFKFAMKLTGDTDRAEDLLQDTTVMAIKARHQYKPGTKLRAWLMTIMRNKFFDNHRREGRFVEDVEGAFTAKLTTMPKQSSRIGIEEIYRFFSKLPDAQQRSLMLVGILGHSYDEAAEIEGCSAGTIKSRVSRGRNLLEGYMKSGDYASDHIWLGAVDRSLVA